MAVTDNLKIAAASIRKAADDLRREIDALRRDMANRQREKENIITNMNRNIASRQSELSRVGEPNQRQQIQREVQDMTTMESRLRLDLKNDQDQFNAAVKARENALAGLENQARSIDSQAGTTGLL